MFQQTLTIYAGECFNTLYRSKGLGTVQGFGRLASVVTPSVIIYIYVIDPYAPFLFLSGTMLLAFLLSLTFTQDRT
jgi:hypothetical protein